LVEMLSLAWAANDRDDPWFVPIAYEPDCEFHVPTTGFRTLGLDDCYRGHAGQRELTAAVKEPFLDLRMTPEHLIDLGERWVVRLAMFGTGRASGVSTHQVSGVVYHVSSRGRIARQDIYWTWEETLAAAGLDGGR
jgi:SnoaL-like protein